MPGWLIGFALFVGVCVLVSWGARRLAIIGARLPGSAQSSIPGGPAQGTLGVFFDKLSEFEAEDPDNFFVCAMHKESEKFVQTAVYKKEDGTRGLQFDIPLNALHAPYEDKISFEARSRGFAVEVTSNPGMRFLDIDFNDRTTHDAFARWVFTQVFNVAETDAFEISWG